MKASHRSFALVLAVVATLKAAGLPSAPTNAWVRTGEDALASTDANWSLGFAPTNQGAVVYLGAEASAPYMTWDLTNAGFSIWKHKETP